MKNGDKNKQKGKSNTQVLSDHKKEGKRLIPPIMQLPMMQMVSFRDKTMPCLIWLSALFVRIPDREAVQKSLDLITRCHEVLGEEAAIPPLVFLNSFSQLSDAQREEIASDQKVRDIADFLWLKIAHQILLFKDHPLAFLFSSYKLELPTELAIEHLKEDVIGLLDRYSHHATKVQVTALVANIASGKMVISSRINLPNFDVIFTAPESDEAKRVAGFARANLNAEAGIRTKEGNSWATSFWKNAFYLEGCE